MRVPRVRSRPQSTETTAEELLATIAAEAVERKTHTGSTAHDKGTPVTPEAVLASLSTSCIKRRVHWQGVTQSLVDRRLSTPV